MISLMIKAFSRHFNVYGIEDIANIVIIFLPCKFLYISCDFKYNFIIL